MAKSYVLPALCAVFAVASAQFLSDAKQIQSKLEALHLGETAVPPGRVQQLEEELKIIYDALPKNPRGAIRPSTARYALHRLFVALHGWHFNGLAPQGDTWASSTPTSALGDRVPEDVARAFRERLNEHGLSLTELAQLAALLEQMVHSEVNVRLAAAFDAHELPWGSALDVDGSRVVLETYMASFVLGSEAESLEKASLLRKLGEVHQQYPTWPNTQAFIEEIRQEMVPNQEKLTFGELSLVAATVGERYGRWQGQECADLRQTLLKKEEHPNTGRVRLSDFYSMALHGGQWQFSESVAYLRQLGALDESDAETLRVIVPNYILGPSNCVASSGYFAVCCLDPCEARMQQLEAALLHHQASPGAILSALNGTVAPALERRLEEMAEHHGGQVPLHSRLFAQWMHHLHPRECPYPHMSGTIKPLNPEIFETQVGESVSATQEEMMQQLETAKWKKSPDFEQGMCSKMWTMEEELVDPYKPKSSPSYLRGLMLAAAVASLAVTIAKMALSLRPESLKPCAPRVYSV